MNEQDGAAPPWPDDGEEPEIMENEPEFPSNADDGLESLAVADEASFERPDDTSPVAAGVFVTGDEPAMDEEEAEEIEQEAVEFDAAPELFEAQRDEELPPDYEVDSLDAGADYREPHPRSEDLLSALPEPVEDGEDGDDGVAEEAPAPSFAELEAAGAVSIRPDALPDDLDASETSAEPIEDQPAAAKPGGAAAGPGPSDGLFQASGLTLHFEAWGDPGAPAVIAFHDAGQDLRAWWPVVRALGGEYRLIGIDLPGHGGSPSIEPGTWSTDDVAAFAAGLMGHLGIQIAAVAGYGLGARVALDLIRAHPTAIATAVLADLAFSTGGWSAYPPDEVVVERRGPGELGKRIAAPLHDSFYASGVRQRYARMDRDGLLGALVALRRPPEEYLMKCPVLICYGDEDGASAEVSDFAGRLPACRFVRFRSAPPPVVHSRPEDFGEQVYRFLRAVEAGETVAGRLTV